MDSFRTEIALNPDLQHQIQHHDGIVMLGSCFTDNVGQLLQRDGFDVMHNPMGVLYNPASISRAISRAMMQAQYGAEDFVADDAGLYHCLDYASKYAHASAGTLARVLNDENRALSQALSQASAVIITLGTSFVYERQGTVVGNCHKFPAACFTRRMLTAAESAQHISSILQSLPDTVKTVIFTVSPIRHTADGLHGNQLSKASLLLAIESVIAEDSAARAVYFPAYEILIDDLRDYRFYASDMKHPSEVAIDYIYEKFASVFFSAATREQAAKARKLWKQSAHRKLQTIKDID